MAPQRPASEPVIPGNYFSNYKRVCATPREESRKCQAQPVCAAWDPEFLPVTLRTPVGFYQMARALRGIIHINRGKRAIKKINFL